MMRHHAKGWRSEVSLNVGTKAEGLASQWVDIFRILGK